MTLLKFIGFSQEKQAKLHPLRSLAVFLLFNWMPLLSCASGQLREGREFKKNGFEFKLRNH
jgi:hypothetical protein